MSRVLIFGPSGNIGKSLADTLEDFGHQVTRVSRHATDKGHAHIHMNLEQEIESSLIPSEHDYAFLSFNIGSTSENLSRQALEKNTNVTKNLVKILSRKEIRIGLFSSAAVFDGLKPEFEPNANRIPNDSYGAAKIELENFLLSNNCEFDIYRTGKILGNLPVIDKWTTQCNQELPLTVFPNKHIAPLSSKYLAEVICEKLFSSSESIHQISGQGDISYLDLHEMFMEVRRYFGFETSDLFDFLGTATHFESLKPSGMFKDYIPPSSLETIYDFLIRHVSKQSKSQHNF